MGLRDIVPTLAPGFRFYPSDEELVYHYLYKKICKKDAVKADSLVEINLHTCEPWQLPDVAKLNSNEWYFFSFRDRKYSTGYRANRATNSGYWKATGKDRKVRNMKTRVATGMRKTLVFYKNRAPNGIKTEWIMHEYRMENLNLPPKVGAEFVGTFILIFAATAGPIVNEKYINSETLIGGAACTGLAVILSTGHISGAHLNPSLTIAFAALRHFPWVQVPAYIAAQVSASICASFALKGVFHPFGSGGVTVPTVPAAQAFALEFLITFNLLFVATAVATDTRAVGELAGLAVGATVMLNILVAGPSSGGSMNPVRSLGPAVAAGNYKSTWIYLVATTLGAVAGSVIYTLVRLREEDQDNDNAPPARQVSIKSFRR